MTNREEESVGADDGPLNDDVPEAVLDEREYFLTGQWHVEHVLGVLRRVFDPAFMPRRVLDIGCGRGRATLALARHAASVMGTDPSAQNLTQARSYAHAQGINNIEWVQAAAGEGIGRGCYDLVHHCVDPQVPYEPAHSVDLDLVLQGLAPNGLAALCMLAGPAGDPALTRALARLRLAETRHCHVEFGAGSSVRAMLFFGLPPR